MLKFTSAMYTKICGHLTITHLLIIQKIGEVSLHHFCKIFGTWLLRFVQSATRTLVSSGSHVKQDGLVCSWHSNSSQRCSIEVRLGLLRPFHFFHSSLAKPYCYGPHFVHRVIVILERVWTRLLSYSEGKA